VSSSGGVFGFQFGHNWQWGPVVGGLEIDFSGADIKGSNTFSSPIVPIVPLGATVTRDVKIDELASARGRLGYLIFPNWLLYGTAGIGWGHTRITNTSSLTVALDELLPTLFTARQTNFFNEFGWVAGAGLEWKFADHWLLRGEWLHYDFARDSHNQTLLGTTILFDGGNPRTTVDVARAALSYKF
jgi:opacity protein-like surface antigen